jgi:hypothetical protein
MGEHPPTTEAPAMMPSPTATTTRCGSFAGDVLRSPRSLQRHVAGRRRGRRHAALCHRATTCSFPGSGPDEAVTVRDVDVPAARRGGDELVEAYGLERITEAWRPLHHDWQPHFADRELIASPWIADRPDGTGQGIRFPHVFRGRDQLRRRRWARAWLSMTSMSASMAISTSRFREYPRSGTLACSVAARAEAPLEQEPRLNESVVQR